MRTLRLSVMLMLIINMSYLGVFFVAPTPVEAAAIQYTLQGQKVNLSFVSGNICNNSDDCYAEGDSVPVKLTIKNLEAGSSYSVGVAHDYKNGSGVIGYDRFESPDSWNASADTLSFSNIITSGNQSKIEYTLNFKALSDDVELKWLAVLGDNASDYGNGATLHFNLTSGVGGKNIGNKDVAINPKNLDSQEEPVEPVEPVEPDEPAEIVCTLNGSNFDYIIDLNNTRLLSNSSLSNSRTLPYDVSFLDDGEYSVTLQAHDGYSGRSGVSQDHEQYKLVFFDENGLPVATSSPHADLADNVDHTTMTQEVNTNLYISGASTVKGVHAYYHNSTTGAEGPNSLNAVCFGLKKISSPEPSCGDGIVQDLEQCDGNDFSTGYEDGFTCNNECKVEVVTPQCELDDTDYDYVIDLGDVRLFSDGSSGNASSTPGYNVSSVVDGQYSVTVQAFDGYFDRYKTNQKNEQYKLVFFDENGAPVATSSPHADLDDGVNFASTTQQVNTALQLTGVKTVKGVHAYYHNDNTGAEGPNSLNAVCFGLKKSVDSGPTCGDGVINQALEQCDSNSFPDGYGHGFTCSSTCQIEEVIPVCSLEADDYDYVFNFDENILFATYLSGSMTNVVSQVIPEGDYSVTLEAYDGYYDRYKTNQLQEQYQLVFFDENGTPVATSSPHADLADGVNYATTTEKVNTDLHISGATSVRGVHAFYGQTGLNANSVRAVCAGIKKNGSQEEATYSWVTAENYGACSVTCGGGIQTKPITCINTQTQEVVPDTNCDVLTKPAVQSQACNTQSCGGGGGGTGTVGGGGGGSGGGGGGGFIPFSITNPQITMQCASNGKVDVTLSWLTTYAADSRAVYDTISRAGSSLGSAPNYGYASSTVLTGTQVTGHSVVINNLEPNTYYYFRPISKYNFSEIVGEEKPLTQTLSCAPGTNQVIVLGEEGAPVLTLTNKALTPVVNAGAKGVEYEIVVTNTGDLTSFNTILKNVLPNDFTYSDFGGDEWTWALGDLNPGENKKVVVKVDIASSVLANHYISDASVRSDNHDNVTAPASIEVRRVIVLAETGFNMIEFLALLSLLTAFAGTSLFLRRKAFVKA